VFLCTSCASMQQRVQDDYHIARAEVGAEVEGLYLDGTLVICIETEMLDTVDIVRTRLELEMTSVFSRVYQDCDADGCRFDRVQTPSGVEHKAHLIDMSRWEDRLVVCGRGEVERANPLPLDHPLYDIEVVPSEVIPGR